MAQFQSYYLLHENKGKEISPNRFEVAVKEFVVHLFDQKDNNPFFHQPHYVELKVNGKKMFLWDFRKTLTDGSGRPPKIFDLFADHIQTPKGRLLTQGNYNEFQFLVRIPVYNEQGAFTITVMDAFENKTFFRGRLPGKNF